MRRGVGLAGLAPGLAVLAVHLDDVDSCSGEEAGEAGPIGARPLHADLADVAEGLKPGQQSRVPVGVGPEGLGAEQASDLVEGGGYVDLAVGVDATSDGARASTMVMPSLPFLKSVEGWHGRPEKDDGEVGLLRTDRPLTPLERGAPRRD